jgi:UDP-N-acetylglucosamine 2-epimerase
MKKLKVMTVVGTRPEIIRLSCTIHKLDKYCEHILVHTGQNYDYELNQIFFNELNIRKPDYFLNAAGENAAETIGNVIISIDKLLSTINPDSLIVLGDTNSCMAAIPAKRKKIPIFHMEAGNRCFDMRVPEEINRRIVDHVSDVNLPYSTIARDYLLREGLPPDRVIKTGSPMMEVLTFNKSNILNSTILEQLKLKEGKYFLVSCHREENINDDKNFDKLVTLLNKLSEIYEFPIVVSTHPRTRNKIELTKVQFNKNIQLLKPLGFADYNKLQINSFVVLSDSGTINEESSILNFPALNIREAHERPEGMEEAAVMMVGLEIERVMQALQVLVNQSKGDIRVLKSVADYQVTNFSEKIIRILHSYTDYVNRVVWSKY